MLYQTPRLVLRQWKAEDFEPFARLNADPEVMRYFPNPLSPDESDAMASKICGLIEKDGYGFWAVEEKESGQFIGFTGLHQPAFSLGFSPFVEIGWRLARPFWGKGYATEAANKALAIGFERFDLPDIYSFTTVSNQRSQAVMERIGMRDCKHPFMHPNLPCDHPLVEHVLYRLNQPDWRKRV